VEPSELPLTLGMSVSERVSVNSMDKCDGGNIPQLSRVFILLCGVLSRLRHGDNGRRHE
jgi:hypothetical protein